MVWDFWQNWLGIRRSILDHVAAGNRIQGISLEVLNGKPLMPKATAFGFNHQTKTQEMR